MIERTQPGSPPRIPPTNDQRWAAVKPLYDAVRNDEARGYEYARMEMMDSERSTGERQ